MEHDPLDLRPQAFGHGRARDVHDPIVEPGWDGARVLVHHGPRRGLALIDIDGSDQAESVPEICAALEEAIAADSVIIDGYLTYQATAHSRPTIPGRDDDESLPRHLSRFMLGGAANLFTGERGDKVGTQRGATLVPPPAAAADPDVDAEGVQGPMAFVAVDLLAVDGTSLLDIPLLERKRILDGVVAESMLVRKTPFLREPINSFLLTWRSAGFGELAYKDPNSRYRPGEENTGWALAPMPRR